MEVSKLGSQQFTSQKMTTSEPINNMNSVTEKVDSSIQMAKEQHVERDKAKMDKVVESLNEFLQPMNLSLKFEVHEKLDRYYVKIVDSETDEIIREVPSEQLLDMYASMVEFMGLFVDQKI